MATKKQVLRNEPAINRTFSYEMGNVSLNFSLRIDVDTQLNDFSKLLEAALVDIKEQLADNKNRRTRV